MFPGAPALPCTPPPSWGPPPARPGRQLHLLWGEAPGYLLEEDLEPSHGEFQTQRPRDLGATNCERLLPLCMPFFSSSLSFRAQLELPLLQEALPDASSPCWPLPLLTLLSCSAGQGGVEDGAWALVAEVWGLDLLCHLSSVTLGKSLNFSGTPSLAFKSGSVIAGMIVCCFLFVSRSDSFIG